MHIVPDPSKKHVVDFCAIVVSRSKPMLIDCRPVALEPLKECFSIVPEHVASNGGTQLIGWAIWEWPRVLIEAEFHTVWEQPDGTILDITPNGISSPVVLFLPDTDKKYAGRQVDNIRQPLTKDWDITRLIFLHRRYTEILNQGNLAHQHGEITLTGKSAREVGAIKKETTTLHRRLTKRYS